MDKKSICIWFFFMAVQNNYLYKLFIHDNVLFLLAYGRNVKVTMEQPLDNLPLHAGKNTVTYEARLLKAILLDIMEG